MIKDYQVQRNGDQIILGIAVQDAVLDIVTTLSLLQNCQALLTQPHQGLVNTAMGKFGNFQVTLNLDADDAVSIFIDGPDFSQGRVQSSAIWPDKESLLKLIEAILKGG